MLDFTQNFLYRFRLISFSFYRYIYFKCTIFFPQITSKMRDLKQCLIDLLRSGGISVGDNQHSAAAAATNPTSKLQHKPKKLHEYTAADCNKAFLRKYYDVGVSGYPPAAAAAANKNNEIIYFNENLTMTSKYDMRQYPLSRYPSCPLSSFSNSDDSVSPQSSRSDHQNHVDDSEESSSRRFDYSSSEDDRATLINCFHSSRPNEHLNCYENGGAIGDEEDHLDSFCTLCTSSFSYNKCCRYCDNSLCGSQCNSEHTASLKIHKNHIPTPMQRNNLALR